MDGVEGLIVDGKDSIAHEKPRFMRGAALENTINENAIADPPRKRAYAGVASFAPWEKLTDFLTDWTGAEQVQ
jgi:hypothetical protein